MLKRTWSIRRQQTYSLSRRVDPGTALHRDKGMIRCQVALLDENVFTCDVDVSLLIENLRALELKCMEKELERATTL